MTDVKNNPERDPVPETFDSIEEMAEFWDTHDLTDYEDHFSDPIEITVNPLARNRRYEIDTQLIEKIRPIAQEQGIPIQQLINQLLAQALSH